MKNNFCLRCNRPLKDPDSISIGFGPRCRMTNKQEGSKGPTADLFGNSKHYSHIEQNVLIIIDLAGGGRSVTEDIDNVLLDLFQDITSLDKKIIIYRDQLGIFDGIHLNEHGEFERFYELNTRLKKTAIKKSKKRYL